MKTNIVNDFLVYAIEEYKYLEKKTAKEIMKLFSEYNVFDYITKNYEALHTIGGLAITDDINIFINNKRQIK
ncbi:MAG: DUF3791 domain-containing protein [Treponema sp.]|nr:DUF3791 domain-containing protein [Treponema sp.]